MTRRIKLSGLSCLNCANKIEEKLKQAPGINQVNMNFAMSEVKIQANDNINIEEILNKILSNLDDNITIANAKSKTINFSLIRIFISLPLLLLSFYFQSYSDLLLILGYIICSYKIIWRSLKNISRGKIFDENFLMSLATITALLVNEYLEAFLVVLLYTIGQYFEERAVNASRRSITELMDLKVNSVNLISEQKIITVPVEEVKINDIFVVKAGEKIALDGVVIEGKTSLDTKAITGESIYSDVKSGDEVISGCINISGLIHVKATKTYENSTISKIVELIETASSKKSSTEVSLTTFAKYYTPVVVLISLLVFIIPVLFFNGEVNVWLLRMATILIISCPCAIVISIPLTYFSGIGVASKFGILVKGSNHLEAISDISHIIVDKTGTITNGEFTVFKYTNNKTMKLAASLEKYSSHPIAVSITSHVLDEDLYDVTDLEEMRGMGMRGFINGEEIFVGKKQLLLENNIVVDEENNLNTVVYVSLAGKMIGSIHLKDQIKPTSSNFVKELHQNDIKITMLSGDKKAIVKEVSDELKIDDYYAEVTPIDKVSVVEEIITNNKCGKVGMVGDGINDAPVLKRADISFAMGGAGSDAAIEASDAIITNDDPMMIIKSIAISRMTKQIVTQNLIFALTIKVLFLFLATLGISTMVLAIFADVGVTLICIFNAIRISKIKI